jgi:centrosomal protein CEP120
MTKAKNHYKEQWTRALQEIAAIKKREDANAKSLLKKQQQELEHLRLRYLAAEENELMKTDEKQLQSLKNELEKLKLASQRSASENDLASNLAGNLASSSTSNLGNIDPTLQEHINRLVEERDTLLRTGVYSNTDAIIIELDKRIRDCLKEAKLQQ